MRFPEFTGEWEKTALGEVTTDINYGLNLPSKEFDGKTVYIRITDIDESSRSLISSGFTSPDGELKDNLKVAKNDILIARTGASTGKSFIFDNYNFETYFAGFLIRFRPKTEYDPHFLYYNLNTNSYEMFVRIMSARSGQPGINSEEYKSYSFSIPSLNEQNKISSFMKALDKRIEIQRKLIDLYKSLIKSIYTYSVRTNNIKTTKLSELIQSQLIKVIKPSDLGYFDGYRTYLSTSSIIESKIVSNEGLVSFDKRPSRASLKPINNSVWFAKMKNSIKVFLADSYAEQNYIMSTGYYGFLLSDKTLSRWLKFTFMSDYFNDQKDRFSEGSSMSAIKESQLNDIYIPIIINENSLQRSVLFLSKIEKVLIISDEKLNNLLTLKETLLFKLFV